MTTETVSDDWFKVASDRLALLREKKSDTKTGRLRGLYGEIASALARGCTAQDICDALQSPELQVTRSQLSVFLSRERIRRAKLATSKLSNPKPALSTPSEGKAPPVVGAGTAPIFQPIRQREVVYNPLPDISKLI